MYFSLIFFIIIMVPPLCILVGIKKRKDAYEIIKACIIAVSFLVVVVLGMARSSGIALGESFLEMARQVADVIASNEDFAKTAGIADLSYSERTRLIVTMYAGISTLLPSTIIVVTGILSYLQYMYISMIFRKIGQNPSRLVPMKDFNWPPSLFFGYLMLSLLAMGVEMIPAFATANIYMNVSIIFEYMLAVQGLAFVFNMFEARRIPKVIGVVVGFFGSFVGIMRMILFAIGMFDYIFGFRRHIIRK